jgi:hypothetical protein
MTKMTKQSSNQARSVADNFSRKLSREFLARLAKDNDVLSAMQFRMAERWLYGYLARTLIDVISEDDFILTEVPVSRRGGKGRIDFVFTYDGYLFLLELKSTGCGINGTKVRESIEACWDKESGSALGVVAQLEHIEPKDVADQLFAGYATIAQERGIKGIIRLPMLVSCYFATKKDMSALDRLIEDEKDSAEGESLMEKRHQEVKLMIRDCQIEDSYSLSKQGRVRRAPGRQEGAFRATFGYGVFMGHRSL